MKSGRSIKLMKKIFYKCTTCQNDFEHPQTLYYTSEMLGALIVFFISSIVTIFSVAGCVLQPQNIIPFCLFIIIFGLCQISSLCKLITYYVKAGKSVCPYCGSEYFTKYECTIVRGSGEPVDMAIEKRFQ